MSEQLYDGRILVRLEEWDGDECYDGSLLSAPPHLTREEQVQEAIERAFGEVLPKDAQRDEDDDWSHDDLHERLLAMDFTEVPYITWDSELWRRWRVADLAAILDQPPGWRQDAILVGFGFAHGHYFSFGAG